MMNSATVIGVVAGVVVLAVLVTVIAVSVARRGPQPPRSHPHPHPRDQAGRGPTGQHPDPVEGTPSETSVPHWDRRIDPNEGPQ
ncbi:DUF6479 family protein [Demequina gelatinilytica]|uniref:DUF6479 family protein n=1 Tax=Demequina gelatinilytica TaxID=1638980 RepID=UPI000A524C89|nr:DUF6479 family protein [Demequina gelatinilytica]